MPSSSGISDSEQLSGIARRNANVRALLTLWLPTPCSPRLQYRRLGSPLVTTRGGLFMWAPVVLTDGPIRAQPGFLTQAFPKRFPRPFFWEANPKESAGPQA